MVMQGEGADQSLENQDKADQLHPLLAENTVLLSRAVLWSDQDYKRPTGSCVETAL